MRIYMAAMAMSMLLCNSEENQPLSVGIWRAELGLIHAQIPDEAPRTLPFIFEVFSTPSDSFYLEIINGKERIPVSDIVYLKKKALEKDSLVIHFSVYDSYIKVALDDDKMEGTWVVPQRNYQIPFIARHGKDYDVKIGKVHSGFNPATPKFAEFKRDFARNLESLAKNTSK